jgi:putative mRNA 3-end processing factor
MIQFTPRGIYCVPGDFYIDPWLPVTSALITHGHADHARFGMSHYLCHQHTLPILKSRIGENIQVESVKYGQVKHIQGVKVSFHPTGHIIGSSQIRMEYKGRVFVVSGDYKTQNDLLSEPFELLKCHDFVTESTFGLPIYNWQSVERQYQEMRNWVLENRANKKTSVFVGYSLGKAQRIMKALEGIGELYVHYSIGKLNAAYELAGVQLPDYTSVDLKEQAKFVDQGIVIVPPSLLDTKVLAKIPNMAHAICSGWMQVRGARRWRSADAGFAISDHADWQGLLETIKGTEAERVYVTHGQTAVFTKYLNEIGIHAEEVKTQFGIEEEEVLGDVTPETLLI